MEDDMILLRTDTSESADLVEELRDASEEAFWRHLYEPGSVFGKCFCGHCAASMDSLLEKLLEEEKELRPTDVQELESNLRAADSFNKSEAQEGKLAVLMAWLNKDKKHEDLIKCPICKKILLPGPDGVSSPDDTLPF